MTTQRTNTGESENLNFILGLSPAAGTHRSGGHTQASAVGRPENEHHPTDRRLGGPRPPHTGAGHRGPLSGVHLLSFAVATLRPERRSPGSEAIHGNNVTGTAALGGDYLWICIWFSAFA